MGDNDFVWRTEALGLAFPSACVCGSDTLPLLDTFMDTYGEGGQGRLYLCSRCVRLTLATVDTVPIDDHEKVAKQLDATVAERATLAAELTAERSRLTKKTREAERLASEVVVLRSERVAMNESFATFHAEIRERKQNGGRTLAEIKAEIASRDAVPA